MCNPYEVNRFKGARSRKFIVSGLPFKYPDIVDLIEKARCECTEEGNTSKREELYKFFCIDGDFPKAEFERLWPQG